MQQDQPTTLRGTVTGTATFGHICSYAGDTGCRPRHFERPTTWQQPMPGARVRHSSGWVEVGGPEVRRPDKLAWSRRCAMLMGSACSLWNLEHVCATFLELSRYLDKITEPLGRQSDRPWAYHFSGRKWKKEARCHHSCTAPYRNRHVRPMSGRLGSGGEHLELMRPPVPSQLHLHGAVSLTEICEEAFLA